MPRIVPQWHEHLAMPQPLRPHVVFNDGDPAGIAVLVAKPFEDPLRGMPLFSRSPLIRRQDPINDPGKPIQFWTRRRPAPPIPGGTENASILATVRGSIPKRRAASRWLTPSI
jgi:hypothetical protein